MITEVNLGETEGSFIRVAGVFDTYEDEEYLLYFKKRSHGIRTKKKDFRIMKSFFISLAYIFSFYIKQPVSGLFYDGSQSFVRYHIIRIKLGYAGCMGCF